MILLFGIPSEPPLRLVLERLEARRAKFLMVDQRDWAGCDLRVEVGGRRLTGHLDTPAATVALEAVHGAYVRLMDDSRLPDLAGLPADAPDRVRCRGFHTVLGEWLEATPARVLNRARPQASNASKPYQAQRISAAGFSVPATLVTNDPAEVLRFRARYGRIVYKSASGIRSIVREFTDADEARLDLVRWCPVQFQEYVPGVDVRVHAVGHEVFATAIESDSTDYRYASRDGGTSDLRATRLSPDIEERCVSLAEALGLPLAGIDLRVAPGGRIVCFEVNPSPAFSFYEQHTGQPISAAIADWLAA
ncbi:ATP-grasp ribosomal peptide maturase [Sinomonas notoginsengisoli]|uniref:hypothetical protein n=1 Tax=Sinomonas notoginsengisoli TaxID=1457311 RepID=UPI001F2F173F|nr:hypothetical protein [Sinomonas notoginsengisoli]